MNSSSSNSIHLLKQETHLSKLHHKLHVSWETLYCTLSDTFLTDIVYETCSVSKQFQFVPRDAMHKRDIRRRGCLVCVTLVHCVQKAKDTATVAVRPSVRPQLTLTLPQALLYLRT